MNMLNAGRYGAILIGILSTLTFLAPSAFSQETVVLLEAGAFVKTMPDGTQVAMWGYGLRSNGQATEFSSPGPTIEVPAGNTLRVSLRNSLPVPISIMIPGQPMPVTPNNANHVSVRFPANDMEYPSRMRSFVRETNPGQTRNYLFENIHAGTFLYHSGTHPYLQVQMGLAGMATVEAAPGVPYVGEVFDQEIPLIYTEIDVDWHIAIAGDPLLGVLGDPTTAMTVDYEPDYALVNGSTFDPSNPAPIATVTEGDRCLIRCLNAGIGDHTATFLERVTEIAEDGNPTPFPRTRTTVFLAASKTKDLVFQPSAPGTVTIFDRLGAVSDGPGTSGGLIAPIEVAPATP